MCSHFAGKVLPIPFIGTSKKNFSPGKIYFKKREIRRRRYQVSLLHH